MNKDILPILAYIIGGATYYVRGTETHYFSRQGNFVYDIKGKKTYQVIKSDVYDLKEDKFYHVGNGYVYDYNENNTISFTTSGDAVVFNEKKDTIRFYHD